MMHGPRRPVQTPFPYSPHASFMFQSRKRDQQRRRSSNNTAPRVQQYFSNPQNYNALYAMVPNTSNGNSNNHNHSSSASTVTSISTPPPSSAPAHITNLQKQSDPASPATIATTISSQHSTPSPSPARVAIMSDASTVSADGFGLFDDATYMAADMNSKGVSNAQDSFSDGHSSPHHYSPSNISIVVPQYPELYGSYSSQQQQQQATTPQHTQAPQQQTMMATQFTQYPSSMYQNEDEIPELSPTPRKARFPSSARLSVSSVDTYNNNSNRQPTTPVHTPDHSTAADSSSASEAPLIYVNEWLDEYLQLNSDINPSPMPKLGRTYSDAVQDELYNPDLIANDYSAPAAPPMNQYSQMYQQQQQQHTSPTATSPHHRDNSPFRATSPYNASMNFAGLEAYGPSMTQQQQHHNHHQQQQQQPIRNRRESELSMISTGRPQQHQQQLGTPKTISPKDALLEYSSPEGDVSQMNFFGPSSRITSRENSDLEEVSRSMSVSSRRESSFSDSLSNYTNAAAAAPYMQTYSPATSQPPRRYSDYSSATPVIVEKPLGTRADTGAYTCTYSGCGQRFNTSGKLQKHRREAHRKSTPTANSVSTAAAIASRNAQPGPHRCMRPNPSTGKPCNTVFSRPYDLTRHEDTIHNSQKEKVRCEICTDEKTFSRPDALVRHRRVKHGIH
jgi:hypothetical protein